MQLHALTLSRTFPTHFPAVVFSSRRQHVHFACDLSRMTSANSRHRACCHMWTFTTPQDYLQNAAERKDQCQYVPEDFSRNDICEMFRTAMSELGHGSILEQLVVVKEPLLNHYGFQFRVIFKTKTSYLTQFHRCDIKVAYYIGYLYSSRRVSHLYYRSGMRVN